MKIIIWHNPRCRKSREALKFLEDNDINFEIRNYLDDSPDTKELKKVIKLLAISPGDIMRKQEKVYKELGLKEKALSDEELISALANHPKLIERPIIIDNESDRAVMGRPVENLIKFFNL